MTAKQILDETIQYYSEDPNRVARDSLGCYYLKDGKMCAFGRCMTNPIEAPMKAQVHLWKVNGDDVDSYLKSEYRGHKVSFWKAIQDLHDCKYNWTTPVSETVYQRILDADL